MPSLSLFALGSILSIATTAFAALSDKAVLFSDGLHFLDSGTNGGLNAMTGVSYSLNQWAWGVFPKVCYDASINDGYCNINNLEIHEVRYSDCGATWLICRCSNSPFPINKIAEKFGRLPINARQYVRFVQSYPGNPSAFAYQNDLTFFGDFTENQSIFIHETAHNLDWAIGGDHSLSSQSDWRELVELDSCVPDSYAKSSHAENFAQLSVLAAYHLNVQSLFNIADLTCLQRQIFVTVNLVNKYLTYVGGETCLTRLTEEDSPKVCVDSQTGAASPCPGVAQSIAAEEKADGIIRIPNSYGSERQAAMDAEGLERKKQAEIEAGIRDAE